METLLVLYMIVATLGVIAVVGVYVEDEAEKEYFWKWIGIVVSWPLCLTIILAKGIFQGVKHVWRA